MSPTACCCRTTSALRSVLGRINSRALDALVICSSRSDAARSICARLSRRLNEDNDPRAGPKVAVYDKELTVLVDNSRNKNGVAFFRNYCSP